PRTTRTSSSPPKRACSRTATPPSPTSWSASASRTASEPPRRPWVQEEQHPPGSAGDEGQRQARGGLLDGLAHHFGLALPQRGHHHQLGRRQDRERQRQPAGRRLG